MKRSGTVCSSLCWGAIRARMKCYEAAQQNTRHAERYSAKHLGNGRSFAARDPAPETAQDDGYGARMDRLRAPRRHWIATASFTMRVPTSSFNPLRTRASSLNFTFVKRYFLIVVFPA